ncbi:L-dopachrome tautomerase-related protein [Entomobacter blattae]|uniref:SMP-30/Gluconolactonase/LRE-like region domain-containing protein n=1 Tax=Entomobacter blattae TaxID=2762277 RepID=A0A7H1NRU1_9PROT|nr:L-dopachrome tautomerase-related protein [Entomobacter blattae]QNT78501.1 hypothetical protein JGUZn3_12750 [Entomobacter blattae]
MNCLKNLPKTSLPGQSLVKTLGLVKTLNLTKALSLVKILNLAETLSLSKILGLTKVLNLTKPLGLAKTLTGTVVLLTSFFLPWEAASSAPVDKTATPNAQPSSPLTLLTQKKAIAWDSVIPFKNNSFFLQVSHLFRKDSPFLILLSQNGDIKPYPNENWNQPLKPNEENTPQVYQHFLNLNGLYTKAGTSSLWVLDAGLPAPAIEKERAEKPSDSPSDPPPEGPSPEEKEANGKSSEEKGAERKIPEEKAPKNINSNNAGKSEGKPKGAKLIEINTLTDQVTRVIPIPVKALHKGSLLSQIRIADNKAYIADAGCPALLVVNLQDGETRRLLERHPSLTGMRALIVNNKAVQPLPPYRFLKNTNALELSPDETILYYLPGTGPLFLIRRAMIDDPKVTPIELSESMMLWYNVPSNGGMTIAPDGTLYFSDIANKSIIRLTPDRKLTTIATNAQLQWPGHLFVSGKIIYIPATTLDGYTLTHPAHEAKPFTSSLYALTVPLTNAATPILP